MFRLMSTDWCTEDELFLNIQKSKEILFYKGNKHVLHDYLIDNNLLCRIYIGESGAESARKFSMI